MKHQSTTGPAAVDAAPRVKVSWTRTLVLGVGLVAWAFTSVAIAQPFPSRPITLVVPFPPGGSSDALARALGKELASDLKQPVVIDNRPGASQVVAGSFVARSAPNGYTLLVLGFPNLIPPSLLKTLPYTGNTGFAGVARLLDVDPVLVASPKLPVSNFQDLVALLKANPGKYTYGTAGVGSPMHAWTEMLTLASGTKALHVPFKSTPDVVVQLMSGEIDFGFVGFGALQMADAGKLKPLGVPASTRDTDHPEIATIDEQGLKGFGVTTSYAVVAPKGTPPEILRKLNEAIVAATVRDSFLSAVRPTGGVKAVRPMSPKQTDDWIADEDQKYGRLVKDQLVKFE